VLQNVTALQDRTDQQLQRSLRNYYALQEQNAMSPNKLLLNGTIDGDVDDGHPDDDDEEIAVDVEDPDDCTTAPGTEIAKGAKSSTATRP